LAISQLIAYGSLYYVFPVLLVPMERELGWSRPQISLAFTIGLCVQAACSYTVGRLIDRSGARVVMTAGALAGAVLLVLWSRLQELWHLYAVWALLGAISSTVLYEAAFAACTRRLGDDYRVGITVITLVGGFASTLFVPLVSAMLDVADWRTTMLVVALLQLPLAWLLAGLRDRPAGSQSPPAGRDGSHADRPEPLPGHRRLVLASLATSYAAFAFMYTALLVHFLPMLAELGLASEIAILAYALIGPGQFLGRFAVLLLERQGSWNVVTAGFAANLLPLLSLAILLAAPATLALSLTAAMLFGAGIGIKTIVQATAAAELLGRHGYGATQGLLSVPALLAQASAPFASAVLWSSTGGYTGLLVAALACAMLSLAGFTIATLSNRP
jgi:sugar phosphate permease